MNGFRDWLNALFGSDGGRVVQMVVALAVVFFLLWLITRLFRRLFAGGVSGQRSGRLSVVETTPVDHQRRLLLVRRDDIEHLVMIGGPNDLLVESRILRGQPVLAGRPVAAPLVQPRPAAPTPVAAQVAEPMAMPAAGPDATSEQPSRARRLSGAAASVAAAAGAAGAGALARVRTARAAPPETAPEPPLAPIDLDRPHAAVKPAPLGRTAPVAEPIPPRPTQELRREPPPPVAEPAAPPDGDRVERGELVGRIEQALGDLTEAVRPPVRPRALDQIDLLADFDTVAAELRRPPISAEPTPKPAPREVPPREVPPAPVPAAVEPPHPPRPAVEVAPPTVEETQVHVAPEVHPVDVGDRTIDHADLARRLESSLADVFAAAPQAEPAHPIEPVFTREIAARDFERTVEPPAPTLPSFDLASHVEPTAVAPLHPAPIVAPSEPIAPSPVASAAVAPEPETEAVTPPEAPPARERSQIDELEEEMARLLSELSGQPRR